MNKYTQRIERLSSRKQAWLSLRLSQERVGESDSSTIEPEVESSGLRLVAYVVPTQQHIFDEDRHAALVSDLRRLLGEKLPAYMVPARFVLLDSLPLNPNGKVDRNLLPEPETAGPVGSGSIVYPRDEDEEAVAEIWKELLGMEEIGIFDNFFDLGGHSLLVTRMLAQVREIYSQDIPVSSFFQSPTIADLVQLIRALRLALQASAPFTRRQEGGLQERGRETFEL